MTGLMVTVGGCDPGGPSLSVIPNGSPATLWVTNCGIVQGPVLFGAVPRAEQGAQTPGIKVNGAVADSAGGPVWLATSGFEPSASLTVFTMIEPLIVPLAVGVSATESTVWPALAVLKATVTGPPCGFQLAPDSDTGKPKTQAAEAGPAGSGGGQAEGGTPAGGQKGRRPPAGVGVGAPPAAGAPPGA